MTYREKALLALVAALWRELAAVRDEHTSTACFDGGASKGPVRDAVVRCLRQVLGDEIAVAVGEPIDARLPCIGDDVRNAWKAGR